MIVAPSASGRKSGFGRAVSSGARPVVSAGRLLRWMLLTCSQCLSAVSPLLRQGASGRRSGSPRHRLPGDFALMQRGFGGRLVVLVQPQIVHRWSAEAPGSRETGSCPGGHMHSHGWGFRQPGEARPADFDRAAFVHSSSEGRRSPPGSPGSSRRESPVVVRVVVEQPSPSPGQ